MGQLILRDVEDEIIEALKARAQAHGRSAEAEHREILRAALGGPAAEMSLWDWLRAMPDGGDEDFARHPDLPRKIEP